MEIAHWRAQEDHSILSNSSHHVGNRTLDLSLVGLDPVPLSKVSTRLLDSLSGSKGANRISLAGIRVHCKIANPKKRQLHFSHSDENSVSWFARDTACKTAHMTWSFQEHGLLLRSARSYNSCIIVLSCFFKWFWFKTSNRKRKWQIPRAVIQWIFFRITHEVLKNVLYLFCLHIWITSACSTMTNQLIKILLL